MKGRTKGEERGRKWVEGKGEERKMVPQLRQASIRHQQNNFKWQRNDKDARKIRSTFSQGPHLTLCPHLDSMRMSLDVEQYEREQRTWQTAVSLVTCASVGWLLSLKSIIFSEHNSSTATTARVIVFCPSTEVCASHVNSSIETASAEVSSKKFTQDSYNFLDSGMHFQSR